MQKACTKLIMKLFGGTMQPVLLNEKSPTDALIAEKLMNLFVTSICS